MKRCPQCGRDYTDETLSFCLDDGAPLLDGPASLDGSETAILPAQEGPEEAATRVLVPKADSVENGAFLTGRARHIIVGTAVVIFALFVISLSYYYYSGPASRDFDSIAVLPFVNSSGDPEVDYLSDGLTESLIGSLSRVPGLSVKASSTVFFYKGKQDSPKRIGETLDVEAMILGRIVKQGETLDVNVELVDAETEAVIWSNRFNRKMGELPALQSEIAREVSDRIRSTLTGEARKTVTREYTSNAQAYEAYLRGRFHWNRRTMDGFERAEGHFKRAIELDPDYALAWSGLADTYFLMPEFGTTSQTEVLPKARSAAAKALELDPGLAEAQSSMAYILHTWVWDFEGAEVAYKKALELNPNYATAHQWYGELLAQQQRFEEALVEGKKAIDLDPLSFVKHLAYGQTLWLAGRNQEALESFSRALSLEPKIAVAHKMQCLIYFSLGDKGKAAAECEKAFELGGDAFKVVPGVALVLAGDNEKAADFLSDYNGLSSRQILDVAYIHLFLGDKERALDGLELLVNSRSVFALFLETLPQIKDLHDEPRFRQLVNRVGLRGKSVTQ